MKKLGLLIAMILCVTIGGVYAAWVYPQTDDVADITHHQLLTLPDATFEGTYGTYKVTPSSDFAMTVDPQEGTLHTTALYITGSLTISFTPNAVAHPDVKAKGVATTFQFTLSNANWKFDGKDIVTLKHDAPENINLWNEEDPDNSANWKKGEDGVFTYTLTAEMLKEHISLTAFDLNTKNFKDIY